MFSVFGKIGLSLLKGYVAKLATKEVMEFVLFEIAEAMVRNTKTPHDDRWLEKFKKLVAE